MLETAISIALECHRGQKDKGGTPYILHPLRLMLKFQDETHQIVAVLHDVIEDGNITLDSLKEKGFSKQVVDAVECLTRRDNEDYMDFIARLSQDPIAKAVKIEDLKDNMNLSRLPELSARDLERIKKYHRAVTLLTSDLKNARREKAQPGV